MMIAGDKDFIPPLSSRSSTTQKDLTSSQGSIDGLKSYFEEMKKQRFMVCLDGEILVSFVYFKENFTNDKIFKEDLPNIYLSTLIMRPEYRGQKVTQTLYENLFNIYKDSGIFTRTWSTNAAHIRILSKFDFETIATVENDRGEGIDTIYFAKRR
ncbi:MAG: GNAT family N-acetyltransferase [Clostridia bacterium]|nr:GNAT family N-acetyltransferase [Clostridia bacterium]